MEQTKQCTFTTSSKKGTSVSYTLFLYREELSRRNTRYMRLSKTKICLTDGLISKTIRNIPQCSVEDLKACSREMQFKNKLKQQIHRLKRLQELGVKNASPNLISTDL